MANKSEHKGSNGTMHLVRVYQAQDVQDKVVQRKDMTLEIYQILLPDSLSLISFCAARETSHVEGPIIFSRVTSCVGRILPAFARAGRGTRLAWGVQVSALRALPRRPATIRCLCAVLQ